MSFRYRLAPKHTFPTQFHDCYAVVKTVLTTADKYGIDSNRVVVAGDSAGGNLATAIALKLRDENLRLAAQVRKKVLNLVPKVLSHLSQSLSSLPPPPSPSPSLSLTALILTQRKNERDYKWRYSRQKGGARASYRALTGATGDVVFLHFGWNSDLTLIYLLCLFLKVVWEAAILGYLEINLVIFENFPKGNKEIFRTNLQVLSFEG